MMSEAPGPINFTMFLTMFGERLNGTDPEDVIRNAFTCFDEDGSGSFGFLGCTLIKNYLTNTKKVSDLSFSIIPSSFTTYIH